VSRSRTGAEKQGFTTTIRSRASNMAMRSTPLANRFVNLVPGLAITLLTPLLGDIDKPDLRLLKDKTQMLAIRTMEECFSTIANIASIRV
jgi:hypothetical protein